MACPKIKLSDRQIFVVSGFDRSRDVDGKQHQPVIIDQSALEAVAAEHKDAIAFGYVNGNWVPAA